MNVKKKQFLVTGASGFIASHVSDFLTDEGLKVTLFDKIYSNHKKKKQKMILGNLNNTRDLDKVTKNIHTIFHFAATADLIEENKNSFTTVENNIMSAA